MTHSTVRTPLQSESYMYISQLVKTRDLYPGLLQFALFSFSIPSLPLLVIIFLFFFLFHLFSLIINLVEVLSRPFHSKGT
jgi:hypothetical protein